MKFSAEVFKPFFLWFTKVEEIFRQLDVSQTLLMLIVDDVNTIQSRNEIINCLCRKIEINSLVANMKSFFYLYELFMAVALIHYEGEVKIPPHVLVTVSRFVYDWKFELKKFEFSWSFKVFSRDLSAIAELKVQLVSKLMTFSTSWRVLYRQNLNK